VAITKKKNQTDLRLPLKVPLKLKCYLRMYLCVIAIRNNFWWYGCHVYIIAISYRWLKAADGSFEHVTLQNISTNSLSSLNNIIHHGRKQQALQNLSIGTPHVGLVLGRQ